jgi:short-subunit dehydrogenase
MSDTLDPHFARRYGPWALIAGGSEGIGRAFAELLAARGIHLLLVARNNGPLEATAAELRAQFGVQVETTALDLTSSGLDSRIEALCAHRDVGLLIYNAGATHGAGQFLDQSLDHATNLVRLNCVGPLQLVHTLGNHMKRRGRGGIVLVSSMSGLAGGGFVAAYGATKSFLITLAEALWFELGSVGVDVIGLIAGATDTPAMARSGARFGGGEPPRSAGPHIVPMQSIDVAREALEHLGKDPVWVAGEKNRQAAQWLRTAPREQIIPAMSAAAAQLYGLELPKFPR